MDNKSSVGEEKSTWPPRGGTVNTSSLVLADFINDILDIFMVNTWNFQTAVSDSK